MNSLRKQSSAPPSWLNATANKLSLAYAIIGLMAFGYVVMTYLLIAKIDEKSDMTVIALDGTRTAHIGPGQSTDEKNNPLWTTLAHNCVDAAFSMDSKGARRRDLLDVFFASGARDQVANIQLEWRPQLLELDARMTPVVRKIRTLRQLDGVVHVMIGGTLEIAYEVVGQQQLDDRDFIMVVALERNSNYAELGDMPFVCAKVNKVAYDETARRIIEQL